jgi:hypothetical protein
MSTGQQQDDTRDWGHTLAPQPGGHDYFDPDRDGSGLAAALAAHHAACAWGWHLATTEGDVPIRAVQLMLLHYQLMVVWWSLAVGQEYAEEVSIGAGLAREVVTDLASPQVLAQNIVDCLGWAGIDANRIKAYRAEESA